MILIDRSFSTQVDKVYIFFSESKLTTLTQAVTVSPILTGFKKELVLKSELKGGKIYDPRFGKTYKAKLKLLDNGNIKVEGCILFICDGEEWQPLLVTTNEDGTRDAILKNDPNEVQ